MNGLRLALLALMSLTLWSLALLWPSNTAAVEVQGQLDLRWAHSDSERGWLWRGLGKQLASREHDGLSVGHAIVQLRGHPVATVSATVVLSGYSDPGSIAGVSEAWLHWQPIPTGSWRSRLKLGAFFPALSEENTGLGWTAPRMISTSALNSWIGGELRTVGAEYTLARPGRFVGSAHDVELFAALFGYNDPAGAMLAWSGWTVGDRVTLLHERHDFAPLPAFQPSGSFSFHAPWIEAFHEIDGRWGAYVGTRYRYAGGLSLSLMRYDNRGDPARFRGQQWSWRTRFNQLGANWQITPHWELLGQYARGNTLAGRRLTRGVSAHFDAGYLLLSHHWSQHRLSLRYDRFRVDDMDFTPGDSNDERGHDWAFAYLWTPPERSWNLALEWLRIDSTRSARSYFGDPPRQIENSLSLAWRWHF